MQGTQSFVDNDFPCAALYLGTRRHVAPVHTQSVLDELFIKLISFLLCSAASCYHISCLCSRHDLFSSCLQDLCKYITRPGGARHQRGHCTANHPPLPASSLLSSIGRIYLLLCS